MRLISPSAAISLSYSEYKMLGFYLYLASEYLWIIEFLKYAVSITCPYGI